MRKLVIVATEYNNTPEAQQVFDQRNWRPTKDLSTHSDKRKLIEKDRLTTALIGLGWEWVEYE